MSRYQPTNGGRCSLCGTRLAPGESTRGRHFWLKHGLVGAMIWRWGNNEPGDRVAVALLTVLLVGLLVWVAVHIRAALGI